MLIARKSNVSHIPKEWKCGQNAVEFSPLLTTTLLDRNRHFGITEWVSLTTPSMTGACGSKHTCYIKEQFQSPFSQLGRWEGCPESMLLAIRLVAGNISLPFKHLSSYKSTDSNILLDQDYCPVNSKKGLESSNADTSTVKNELIRLNDWCQGKYQ